jgi:hypothetical protein
MATRRRGVKTSRRKHTFRNKSKKNRTTRKANILEQVGGLRLFPTSPAKTRWGKRIEKLVIQKMLEKYGGEVLNLVLALPNQEPNDIPSRFYTDPNTAEPTNISVKAKQLTPTEVKTIDAGLPTNVLNSLRDPAPYHMIFVNYTISGNHMSIDTTLRLDLKKLFHPIFSKCSVTGMNKLYEDIEKVSVLIKSKKDDAEARKMCADITRRIAKKSTTTDIVWKINPKISSSNHRIQGTLTIDFDSPYVKLCIIPDNTFDSLSSAESDVDISPRRWMIRESQRSSRGVVRPTPRSSVSARSAQGPRSAQVLLKQSPVVKLTPRVLAPVVTEASLINPEPGIRKKNRFSRTRGSHFSQQDIATLMASTQQFSPPTSTSRRGTPVKDGSLGRIDEGGEG